MTQLQETELIDIARANLMQNYRQQPIVLSRGQGVYVWDVAGNRYLDMTAGIAVCSLGHAHPKLAAAIAAQANKLLHVSNLYYNEENIRLAEALCARSFAKRAFFCNSGAEANEAALKLARRYQAKVAGAPERTTIVATRSSFHGRTIGTVSITGQDKYSQDLGPLFGPVDLIAYGDLGAAERVLSPRKACAMIVEPIQAEGGIIVPPAGYLKALRDLCTSTGTVLIFDEVQTGVGRTGQWFGHDHEGCAPDIMTLAKALGGGVPIGAMLASEEAAKGFAVQPGEAVPHASTFGGNPLACAAALAVLEVIEDEGLLANIRDAGQYLLRGLTELASKHPDLCGAARGRGLLVGLEIKRDIANLIARCREKGMLLSLAGANVLRFVPPLIVKRDMIDDALEILDGALGHLQGSGRDT